MQSKIKFFATSLLLFSLSLGILSFSSNFSNAGDDIQECLEISKTVSTNHTRSWDWMIEKIADVESVELDLGESKTVNYEVILDGTSTDEWKVWGTITLTNPNEFVVIITDLKDIISPDINVTVACPNLFPYTIPASSSMNCTYEKELTNGDERTNTATVYFGDKMEKFTQEEVIFGTPVETDECINVTDDKYGELGEICTNDDITFPFIYKYSLEIEGEECGESKFTNTATGITNDTESKVEDSVIIDISVGGEDCVPEEEEEEEKKDDDTPEVLGTSTVVMASTAGEDSSSLYLIQYVLIILTGASFLSLGYAYFNRS